MIAIIEKENFINFKKELKGCTNIKRKTFHNKELIVSYSPIQKKIGLINYGKAEIIKTDKDGNTTIMRDLKENDIFSNLFFQDSEDEIYITSNGETEVFFIDYYNNLIVTLFDLLILDNKEQNEKIELLSKRSVEEKVLFFLKKRMNEQHIFKVTTSYKAIAEYLFVDRSNLMRELKKMEKKRLIEKKGKTIKILS